ncbi:hypothetical protein SAMN05444287_3123 [Octadecabacter temperatus]|uniref:Uncharacterized protein n=1 Tax=Octadecabacter temperatus TaxID=1458307 RepID=A0A0K0Y8Q1_9RHOB|nr:hypothetical protein [Octadecabacter temperatus]AKS47237.1 hypothetical protein OSB_27130 [Octadecabacter temperatus]SIO44958.1 hypothetical protein SAMN05444287_3123 [Octadecabacter temperatus]
MGHAAGAGIFVVVPFLAGLYLIVLALIGWRLGRQSAMKEMTYRTCAVYLGIACIGPLLWALMGGALGLVDFVAVVVRVLGVVGGFAAVSWAINLDDYWTLQRGMRLEKTERKSG